MRLLGVSQFGHVMYSGGGAKRQCKLEEVFEWPMEGGREGGSMRAPDVRPVYVGSSRVTIR